MRKHFLALGLLAGVGLFGAQVAHGWCGWWTARPCYYVAEPCYYVAGPCCYVVDPCCYAADPCCYVPAYPWTYCEDCCCDWSCYYYSYPAYQSYGVVTSRGASSCSACVPATASPSGTDLTPIPEKGAAPANE